MVRKMAEWLVPVLLGALLLNGVMYLQQPRMIFFPWSTLDATPSDWGLAYDDVTLETQDGIALHGWYILHPQARRPNGVHHVRVALVQQPVEQRLIEAGVVRREDVVTDLIEQVFIPIGRLQ